MTYYLENVPRTYAAERLRATQDRKNYSLHMPSPTSTQCTE